MEHPKTKRIVQPDATDWKIIDILRAHHLSNSEVARRLGLTESTVRQRLKRLKAAGILEVRALLDPNRLDRRQLALICVSVAEARLLDAKAREISGIDGVLSVSIISGRYDLVVEVLLDSNHGLVQFLTEKLSRVEGVSKTETFLVLRSYNKRI